MLSLFRYEVRASLRCAIAQQQTRRCSKRVFSFYDETVEDYASQTPLHVTPAYIVNFAKDVDRTSLLKLSIFLHKELPVRLAHTLRDFQSLPYIVGVNPHIERIYEEYSRTFKKLTSHPVPDTFEKHESFCRTIAEMLNVHANVISDISKGMKEVRVLPSSSKIDFKYIDSFLDRALVQRIGRRVLAELLLVLHQQVKTGKKKPNQHGVYSNIRPADIVENCMSQVLYLAGETFLNARELTYEVVGDCDCELLCVASHLEYILFELCKNAVRATLINGGEREKKVTIRVAKGDAVAIVISDRGGGIEDTRQAGSYGFSTSTPSSKDNEYYKVKYSESGESPSTLQFAGFGFGLPLSRVYSTYAGGRVSYQTLPGYGTDMYLVVPSASAKTHEWEKHGRLGVFDDHCSNSKQL